MNPSWGGVPVTGTPQENAGLMRISPFPRGGGPIRDHPPLAKIHGESELGGGRFFGTPP